MSASTNRGMGSDDPSMDTALQCQPLEVVGREWESDHGRSPGALLIEDDRQMLRAMEHGLRKRGFAVWTALGGKEAIEIYRHFEAQIDIVLSDVQMPGMDGPETLAALRKINPLVCACFMTGDIRRSTGSRLLETGALRIFAKPFPSVAEVAEELWMIANNPLDYSAVGLEPDLSLAEIGSECASQRPEATTRVGFFRRVVLPLLHSAGGFKNWR